MLSDPEIEKLLRAGVSNLSANMESSKQEFERVSACIPRWLPRPDSTLPLKVAAIAYVQASDVFSVALKELNAFLREGKVPARLGEPDGKSKAGAR